MRNVCPSAAAIAVSVLMVSGALAQNLTITNYRLVSEERVSRSESYFTYRADLMNTGPAREALTATVMSNAPNVRTVAGQTNIHFSPVPANGMAPSLDTFTLLIDRSVAFDFSQIQWSFTAPVANAGFNQTAPVGGAITLNGSASTNPSGVGQLSYSWALISRPPASKNQIVNPTSPLASFTVDAPGGYIFRLTVTNGAGSDAASVSVNTRNSAPVANAGPNQTVPPGSVVRLDGSMSSDVDGDQLTYSWQLISIPPGQRSDAPCRLHRRANLCCRQGGIVHRPADCQRWIADQH